MFDVNIVILVGPVVSRPVVSQTIEGTSVCSFSLVTSSRQDGKEETAWHSIVALGELADLCIEKVKAGKQIYVTGRIVYTNRGTAKVIADLVRFEGLEG